MSFIHTVVLSAILINLAGCITLPSIFNIFYTTKSEKSAELLAYLLEIDYYASIDPNLPVEPVLKAFNLEKCELNQIYEILQKSNLYFSQWDIFEVLGVLNISAVETYREFTTRVETPEIRVKNALEILKINETALMDYLLYHSIGKEEITFEDILRKGVYSQVTVAKALNAVNRTDEDLFNFIKPKILSHISSIDGFMSVVRPRGKTTPILETASRVLPMNKTIILEPPLIDVLKAYNKSLENVTSLGTATSFNHVAAIEEHPRWLTENYLALNLNINDTNFMVSNITFGPVLNITANHGGKFLKVANGFTGKLGNCSILNETVSVKIDHLDFIGEGLIYVKENRSVKIGSPLICNELIFGLARSCNGSHINFATFYDSPTSGGTQVEFQVLTVVINLLVFLLLVK